MMPILPVILWTDALVYLLLRRDKLLTEQPESVLILQRNLRKVFVIKSETLR